MRTIFPVCMIVMLLSSSFQQTKRLKLKLPEEFVRIPSGTFTLQNLIEPVSQTHRDSMGRIDVEEFYISKYEVSNQQYREFFEEFSAGLTAGEKAQIACDTAGWDHVSTNGAPLKKYYFSHKAYTDYPVVNIPYDGAMQYCNWMQQRIQLDNPGYEIEVKLPSKTQYIWASMGGRKQAMFPWGNFYLRNRKGEFLCNFRRLNDQSVYRNRVTGKPEVAEGVTYGLINYFTTPVKSFYPNNYGLYNMCGNAAEMIAEKGSCMGGSWNDYGGDVHIRAEATFERSSPTVGFRPVVIVKERNKN